MTSLSPAQSFAPADLLRQRYAETTALSAALLSDLDGLIEAAVGINGDDEHDPEGATIAFERAQVQHLLDQTRAQLTELDEAMGRLEAGTYGICDSCGDAIAAGRLEARPAAARCMACASHRP